jgi:rRNA maturation protein Rpf1
MISNVPEAFESLVTKSRKTDTLNYWFRGSTLDSIKFELEIQDTIRIKTAFLKDPVKDSLVIKKYTTGSLGLKNKLELESNLPVTTVDSSKLIITNIDTLQVPATLKVLENYDRIES